MAMPTVITVVFDLHGGGRPKLPTDYVIVLGDRDQAEKFFVSEYGVSLDASSCPCCGPDFSVYEEVDFDQIVEYESDSIDNPEQYTIIAP